jgi:hypothetical protein
LEPVVKKIMKVLKKSHTNNIAHSNIRKIK